MRSKDRAIKRIADKVDAVIWSLFYEYNSKVPDKAYSAFVVRMPSEPSNLILSNLTDFV